MSRLALFVVLTLCVGLVGAADYTPVTGQYAITGPTLMDPPPGERADRIVLFLSGAAARDFYRGMTVTATQQMCAPESAVVKSVGGVECMFDKADDTYACWVGVRLDSGEAVHTDVPC